MKLAPWLILLCFSLASCSGSKSAQKVSEETPQIELSDADEFIENPTEEPAQDQLVLEDTPVAEAAPAEAVVAEDTMVEEPAAAAVVEESSPEIAMTDSAAPAPYESGAMKEYAVQKNETLMLIAFKIYGDYEKWKELAGYNRDTLNGSTAIKEGMKLKYMAPSEEFVWNPQGLPYLIRTGDTLSGISHNVYATLNKWKLIWENNRPLIKDPNKIYAGFTIYYLEDGREVAGQY